MRHRQKAQAHTSIIDIAFFLTISGLGILLIVLIACSASRND